MMKSWNNRLHWAWERYRLLAFLVVAVYVVVMVVQPLTGCAAVPRRTAPDKQWAAPTTMPGENQATTNTSLLPVLVIAGAVVLMAKRQYGNTTHS